MLFVQETVSNNELKTIDNFFEEFENVEAPKTESKQESIGKYVSSLVVSCYQKSVEEIANKTQGNSIVKRRNFQQIVQESFFYGANRFGNNFIA